MIRFVKCNRGDFLYLRNLIGGYTRPSHFSEETIYRTDFLDGVLLGLEHLLSVAYVHTLEWLDVSVRQLRRVVWERETTSISTGRVGENPSETKEHLYRPVALIGCQSYNRVPTGLCTRTESVRLLRLRGSYRIVINKVYTVSSQELLINLQGIIRKTELSSPGTM